MNDKRTIFLVVSCVAYVALLFVIPFISVAKHVQVTMFVVVSVLMFVQLNISRWFASLTMKPLWATAVLLVSLVLWVGIVLAVTAPYANYYIKDYGSIPVLTSGARPATTQIPMIRPVRDSKGNVVSVEKFKATGELRPSSADFRLLAFEQKAGTSNVAANLVKIFAATAFGYLLSFILRHPNIVLPVGALAAYIDVWTVMVGPTARAMENAPHVVSAVSVSIPAIAAQSGGFQPVAYIGPADFIFLAMFFGAVYRLKMEPRRTFWFTLPILTVGMASVVAGFFSFGLPALPLIGLAVIFANFKHFKFDRQEYIAMGITAVLLVAATVVLMPMVMRR